MQDMSMIEDGPIIQGGILTFRRKPPLGISSTRSRAEEITPNIQREIGDTTRRRIFENTTPRPKGPLIKKSLLATPRPLDKSTTKK